MGSTVIVSLAEVNSIYVSRFWASTPCASQVLASPPVRREGPITARGSPQAVRRLDGPLLQCWSVRQSPSVPSLKSAICRITPKGHGPVR